MCEAAIWSGLGSAIGFRLGWRRWLEAGCAWPPPLTGGRRRSRAGRRRGSGRCCGPLRSILGRRGRVAAARRAASAGSARTLMMASASGPGATGVKSPAPVAPRSCLVIAEVGRHDRAAGGEIHGDLALNRVILAAGQTWMHQHVGAAGKRHHLVGRSGRSGRSSRSPCGPSWAW